MGYTKISFQKCMNVPGLASSQFILHPAASVLLHLPLAPHVEILHGLAMCLHEKR